MIVSASPSPSNIARYTSFAIFPEIVLSLIRCKRPINCSELTVQSLNSSPFLLLMAETSPSNQLAAILASSIDC